MMILRTVITSALALAISASAGGATISMESATMGPASQAAGQQLSASQFIGWRFTIAKTMAISHVGGHLGGANGKLFAAIVSLPTLDSLPQGNPFNESNVAASVAFTPPTATADFRVPLSKMLQPGAYALVFGSGRFDATGSGMMANSQQTNVAPTQQGSYVTWRQTLPGQYAWTAGSVNNARFVLVGAEVAAASDFNLDGKVDGSDLLVWKANFGGAATAGVASGDADLDGDVDGADYLAWQRSFARTSATAVTIPEPATAVLAAATMLGLIGRLRRAPVRPAI